MKRLLAYFLSCKLKLNFFPKNIIYHNAFLMDLNFLIKTFHELTEPTDRLEILQDICDTIEKDQCLILSNLTIFFEFLNVLLICPLREILTKGMLLTEIAIKFIGPELDIQFNKISQSLILLLADPEAELRKKTIQILCKFIAKTRNLQMVMRNLINYGMKHKSAFTRVRALNCLPDLIDKEKGVFFSKLGINVMAEILENLTICLFDNDQNVRKEATEIIIKLQGKSYEGFSNSFNKLSIEHQNSFMKIVENYRNDKRQEKFMEITLDKLGIDLNKKDTIQIDLMELKKQFYLTDIPIKREDILNFFPKDYKKNLYFGFLEENLLLDSLNVLDLKAQSQAIQEMSSKCLENSNSTFKSFNNYLSSFYKYLLYLLKNSENFQIITNVLNLLNSILNVPGIQSKIYLPLLTSILMEKLIEERVLIRNQINVILKKVMKILKPEICLKIIMFFLFEIEDTVLRAKKNIWHLYEEGLLFICILFLDEASGLFSNKQKEFPYINFNIKDFLTKISSYLDHKAQKVRKAALETLAVICISTDSKIMLEILHEILTSQIYEELLDKIEKNNYFFLNKNGFLEIQPDKKPIENSQAKENVNVENGLEEIKEKESSKMENEEEKSEIEKELPKWEIPMTQREKFIRRNEEFEKMMISEDMIMKDDGQTKNEIYMPINKIPITNPQKDLALIAKNGKVKRFEEEKIEKSPERPESSLNDEKNLEEKYGKEEKIENEELSLDKKTEEFSILYSDDDSKKVPKVQNKNISKVIAQNKENYLGYQFEANEEKSDESDNDNFDPKAKLPFEDEKMTEGLENKPIETINDDTNIKTDENSKEILILSNHNKSPEKLDRPNTGQIKSIKETILKEFLNFNEDRPLWTSSTPFSPLKSSRNRIKKKLKEDKDAPSDIDRYFLSINDLWSLEDPGLAMHKLLLELKSDKWEDQNNALVTIRRLAKNHKEQLYDMNLSIPHLITDICDLSNSVNPIVCKQSILTLIDLGETLKGNLDIGLDPIVSLILNKTTEFNAFLGDELNKLTKSIVKHCDGNKIMWVISSILGKSGQLPPFKGTIAEIIYLLLEKYRTNVILLKNFPKLIVLLVQLINDLTYSVRQIAKRALFNLLNSQFLNRNDFEQVLQKNLPEKEFSEVKKFIERHKMLIDEKFIEGMTPGFVVHWEENSYKPTEKDSTKQRPNSHLLRKNKN